LDLNKPEVLKKLLESHSLNVETREEWCVPNGELPAIRTVWVAGETPNTGRLDVEVVLTDERRLVECFAGMGETIEQQQKDALQNFLVSSFHVLLAAFWGRVEADQVEVRRLTVEGKDWAAYVGGFSQRRSVGVEAALPESYLAKIIDSLSTMPLTHDVHWCRTFFCNIGSQKRIHEALLDNNQWTEGEVMMQSLDWGGSEGFYSIRNFLVLRQIDSTN